MERKYPEPNVAENSRNIRGGLRLLRCRGVTEQNAELKATPPPT